MKFTCVSGKLQQNMDNRSDRLMFVKHGKRVSPAHHRRTPHHVMNCNKQVDLCTCYQCSGYIKHFVGKYFRVRYKKMREGFIKTQAQYRMLRQRKEYLGVRMYFYNNEILFQFCAQLAK